MGNCKIRRRNQVEYELLLNPTSEPDLRAYYRLNNDYENAQGYSGFDGSPQDPKF